MKAVAVYGDGPFGRLDRDGDEVPYWPVYLADRGGEAVGKVYECDTFDSAYRLASRMARDRRLDLVNDASAA